MRAWSRCVCVCLVLLVFTLHLGRRRYVLFGASYFMLCSHSSACHCRVPYMENSAQASGAAAAAEAAASAPTATRSPLSLHALGNPIKNPQNRSVRPQRELLGLRASGLSAFRAEQRVKTNGSECKRRQTSRGEMKGSCRSAPTHTHTKYTQCSLKKR